MTDVYLYQTNDGGEISLNASDLVTNEGLETAFYLSLFGGNVEDNGRTESRNKQWWGNEGEREVSRARSKTQNYLASMVLTAQNLARLRELVLDDLSWFVSGKYGTVDCSVASVGRSAVAIKINAFVTETNLTYLLTLNRKLG